MRNGRVFDNEGREVIMRKEKRWRRNGGKGCMGMREKYKNKIMGKKKMKR